MRRRRFLEIFGLRDLEDLPLADKLLPGRAPAWRSVPTPSVA